MKLSFLEGGYTFSVMNILYYNVISNDIREDYAVNT